MILESVFIELNQFKAKGLFGILGIITQNPNSFSFVSRVQDPGFPYYSRLSIGFFISTRGEDNAELRIFFRQLYRFRIVSVTQQHQKIGFQGFERLNHGGQNFVRFSNRDVGIHTHRSHFFA